MTTVTINSASYTVSPLTIGDLRNLSKHNHLENLTSMGTGLFPTAAWFEGAIAVVAASLVRKHPECSPEWVADSLQMADVVAVTNAVLAESGLMGKASSPNVASP